MTDEGHVQWFDGLYGGLLAGAIVAVFYGIVSVAILHDFTLAGFFADVASSVIGSRATPDNGLAVALGVGMHFLISAMFGLFYGMLSLKFRSMWHAPFSIVWGCTYGLVVWFVIANVVVPAFGIVNIMPLWEALVANIVFFGFVLSEYMTVIRSRNAAAA
jgi:uncharacterized membrane protein YagU involved in acid resistance